MTAKSTSFITMWRQRGCRNGIATDLILLGVFLILAYIFMSRRGYMAQVDSLLLKRDATEEDKFDINTPKLVPDKAKAFTQEEKAQEQINMRVKRIEDMRAADCKSKDLSSQVPCSIIIHFFDYSFHDMKFTLSSVLQFTPDNLIREIIIVDDGSTLDYIIKEALSYVDKIPKAVLLRNEQQEGSASARMRAAKKAMGANLIFVDPNVIVTPGWLSPLADAIQREQRLVAMPHLDRIHDPVSYEYVKVDFGLVPGFTWKMDTTVIHRLFDYKSNVDFYTASIIRGNIFAITKAYLDELQGLDTVLSEGGGDMLEFSFRVWLCGGKIKILPCSRVGVLGVKEPVKIVSSKNIWHIAELWFDNKKEIVYKQLNKDPTSTITDTDRQALENRKSQFSQLQCKDFSWYLDNVAVEMYIPKSDVKRYGILQIKNGRCMRVSRKDFRIDLGSCTPEHNKYLPRDMTMELTNDGLLRGLGKCLAVQGTAYIIGEDCDKANDHQLWSYDDKQRLVNKWSGYCAMHVTDPDPALKDEKRQIAMAQKCHTDSTKEKFEFSSWKFLPVN